MRVLRITLAVTILSAFTAAIGTHASARATQAPSPADASSANPSPALLTTYCISCHNQRVRTAGLSLDDVDVTHIGANADLWEKVGHKLRSGQMPPLGRQRPDQPTIDAFVATLEHALDDAAARAPNPGRPVTHRLTRT